MSLRHLEKLHDPEFSSDRLTIITRQCRVTDKQSRIIFPTYHMRHPKTTPSRTEPTLCYAIFTSSH